MLRYFAANSDGAEPSPLHGPANLNDAIVAAGPFAGQKFDFTGGWMDAGDMIHFSKTTAFAATALQLAARLDPANAAALNAAADVGIRWLVKAHPAPGLFIMQVADTRDHDVGFRNPVDDANNSAAGIGQRMAYPGMGTDVGGKAAAALALAAARAPEPLRAQLIAQATDWYQAGEAAGKVAGRPDGLVGEFVYNNEEEGAGDDDMATAAVFLWRTTGEVQFLGDAQDQMSTMDALAPGWATTGLLGAADLCGGLGSPALPSSPLTTLACDKLRAGAAAAQSTSRRFAFPVYGEYGWGVTSTNGGGAATAGMAARAGLFGAGHALADGGRDWLLGRNPWGASFVVGYGPNSARHPHHWAVAHRAAGQPVGAVVGARRRGPRSTPRRRTSPRGSVSGPSTRGRSSTRTTRAITSTPSPRSTTRRTRS